MDDGSLRRGRQHGTPEKLRRTGRKTASDPFPILRAERIRNRRRTSRPSSRCTPPAGGSVPDRECGLRLSAITARCDGKIASSSSRRFRAIPCHYPGQGIQRTTARIRTVSCKRLRPGEDRPDKTQSDPPPRHPHRKIRKSGDKNLSPLFQFRFFSRRDSGFHLRKEKQKLRDGIRLRTLPLRPKRPPPPVVFSPLSSFRSMRFRMTRLPISTLFSGKSRQAFPSLSDSHKSAARRQPKDGTPYIVTRRAGGPDAPDRSPAGKQGRRVHTGRQDETKKASCRKPSRIHPAMQGDHTGGNASGRTSTARPPAAGRSERTVRNIIKIIEKRMERKRSTAGLICERHGPSPDGCPSP